MIHELGHVFAFKILGYKVSAPVFIPFLGAVVFGPIPKDRSEEALVGIGGPWLGTFGAILCIIPFLITGHPIWAMGGLLGTYINLFNMIPLRPLDGGRITQAISEDFQNL